jgi:phosphopantetheinyl transferase (holo-ACP synthase)
VGVDDGIVAEAVEIQEIAPVEAVLREQPGLFTPGEHAYASSTRDPLRRLAARLAAKRAAAHLLGVGPEAIEIVRGRGGPPSLRLAPGAEAALRKLGAERALVSLTHGETHAAAFVVLLRGSR